MVVLRSSAGAAAPKRADMDSSSEFLSLARPLRKSARLKGLNDDSFSSLENIPTNGYLSVKEENIERVGIRTRAQRDKRGITFVDMSNQTSSSPQKEGKILKHLRKSPRLQADGEKSGDEHSVVDEADGTAGSRDLGTRFPTRKETAAVRRSSRITRYKLDARNQSALYDRLITNTAEAVLQKMDDMQKMRRRLRSRDSAEENLLMYSDVKRKRTVQSSVRTNEESADDQGSGRDEYSNQEDENDNNEDGECVGEEEDNDEEEEDEEEEDNQKRYEFRQRKAVVRYQAPLDEPRKQSIFFRRHSTPTRRRYSFRPSGPCSPYSTHRSSRSPSPNSALLSPIRALCPVPGRRPRVQLSLVFSPLQTCLIHFPDLLSVLERQEKEYCTLVFQDSSRASGYHVDLLHSSRHICRWWNRHLYPLVMDYLRCPARLEGLNKVLYHNIVLDSCASCILPKFALYLLWLCSIGKHESDG